MWSRTLFYGALCVASASAFMPAPLAGHSGLALRRPAAMTSLKMVDWSVPDDDDDDTPGAGGDRGQVNRSDKVGSTVEARLAAARERAEQEGLGAKSGLALNGDFKEGDRDPNTGRLILDPLKIPDEEHGAPGSWEAYLAMRAKKEGGAPKDVFGNDISGVKPTTPVQSGTWGPPKETKENLDDILGLGRAGDVSIKEVDAEQAAWKEAKDQERAQEEADVEAKMAKWMADAAAKKAAGQ